MTSRVAAASIFVAGGWIGYGVANWLLRAFTDFSEIHRVGLSVVAGVVLPITMELMVVLWNLDKQQQGKADGGE